MNNEKRKPGRRAKPDSERRVSKHFTVKKETVDSLEKIKTRWGLDSVSQVVERIAETQDGLMQMDVLVQSQAQVLRKLEAMNKALAFMSELAGWHMRLSILSQPTFSDSADYDRQLEETLPAFRAFQAEARRSAFSARGGAISSMLQEFFEDTVAVKARTKEGT